jgi:hypothetical protein
MRNSRGKIGARKCESMLLTKAFGNDIFLSGLAEQESVSGGMVPRRMTGITSLIPSFQRPMPQQLWRKLVVNRWKAASSEDISASFSQNRIDPPKESPAQDSSQLFWGPLAILTSQYPPLFSAFDHQNQKFDAKFGYHA